ncbi:TonB-dependent siderophore receptor [Arhodomonas aquaeolei]|uniref:TonB-dependent siderophore receptor n=1 Tax=Arhodomonas aquaeolei TaxID=2369 RepID=UPI0021676F04|nr:TonB-dependent siderophore receptor [Arhodomonas aquaeolei]MCS4505487.1 TonB-dependent siderophore receptor [Arhodomonas aquaeolei]
MTDIPNRSTTLAGRHRRHPRTASSIAILLAGGLIAAAPAMAATAPGGTQTRTASTERTAVFDIRTRDLRRALNAFGQQSGLQVTVATDIAEGVRSRTVTGRLTVGEALDRLLRGTGLAWRFTDERTVVLTRAAGGSTSLQLDPVRVEAAGETADGAADGYVAYSSAAATKADVPLIETPRSVSVITRDEMADRGAQDVVDAVRYSAGVTTGAYGLDPRFDQIRVRGFSVTTVGDYRDGLRQPYAQYGTFRTEPYNLERVEVFKGPTSSLYGASSAGGLVNRVSKRPTTEPHREIRARYSSASRRELAADVSGPLDEAARRRYRVVALAREGDGNFHIADDRLMLAPSFTWQPTADTSLTLIGLLQKDETDSNVASLNRNGQIYDIRASDPDYDYQKVTQYQFGYQLAHRFNHVFEVGQNVRYSGLDLDARYLTGSAAGGGWDGDTYQRGTTALEEDMDAFQVDNHLKARFDTGALQHHSMLGVDYHHFDSTFGQGSSAADPRYDLSLEDPHYGASGPTPDITSETGMEVRQLGGYLRDRVHIGGWRLSAGVRRDRLDQTSTDETAGTTTADRETSRTTGDAGLLYRFDNGLAPYAAVATSFEPVTYRDSDGDILEPIEGRLYEAGLKFQPNDFNALFSIAAYRLVEENSAQYVGYNATVGSYYEAVGEVETNGVELEARTDLGGGVDLTAAYTYTDAEITDDADESDIGNTPSLTPDHSASLWLGYEVPAGALRGLSFHGGLRYIGRTYTGSSNTDTNDAHTEVDASVRYDLAAVNPTLRGASVSFKATNLTDERREVCNAGYCYLGEGRTLLGEFRYRW